MSLPPKYTSPKNWEEDYKYENGNYINRCSLCEEEFHGHKYRFVCKECTDAMIKIVDKLSSRDK